MAKPKICLGNVITTTYFLLNLSEINFMAQLWKGGRKMSWLFQERNGCTILSEPKANSHSNEANNYMLEMTE